MQRESFLQSVLLATKLTIPTLSESVIPRPRLLDTLRLGLDRKLTLVSAPAGFGKTTLLASWLTQNSSSNPAPTDELTTNVTVPKIGWVSLAESDNNPQLFWHYVLAALDQAASGLATPLLAQLDNDPDQSQQTILINLINRILEYKEQLVLVLDDYHYITEPQIHSALSYLLDYLPSNLHLFVVTRQIPPLPIARLRARGQILELDADMLRCTLAETAEFFRLVSGIDLAPKVVQKIHERTEGWLVGLQLFALSLKHPVALDKIIEELNGTQRYILDYLTEEVLRRESEEVQNFLLSTSFLPQFCARLCDAVLDRNDSRQILDYLEAANLFIVKLEGQGEWYRYHPLFAETLRYHVTKQGGQVVHHLHEKASRWFSHQTQTDKSNKNSAAKSVFTASSGLKAMYIEAKATSQILTKGVWPPTVPTPDNLPVVIEPLSERELEVLNLLFQGAANQDIAKQLTLSPNTVKKHTSNIFSKLGVFNRTQAVYRARVLGLIEE